MGNYTHNCVSNSGFSLWRQSAMEFLTRNLSMPLKGHLINSFWADAMRRYWPGYRPCPYDDADRFSAETFFVPQHPQDLPLGWHKPFLHRWTPTEVAPLHDAVPELGRPRPTPGGHRAPAAQGAKKRLVSSQ